MATLGTLPPPSLGLVIVICLFPCLVTDWIILVRFIPTPSTLQCEASYVTPKGYILGYVHSHCRMPVILAELSLTVFLWPY